MIHSYLPARPTTKRDLIHEWHQHFYFFIYIGMGYAWILIFAEMLIGAI